MKKIMLIALLATVVFTLVGCKPEETINPNRIALEDDCRGMGDYIVVNGQCLVIGDLITDNITISGDETRVEYSNRVEVMTDFVADITGSKGLAVVPRDVYDETINLGGQTTYDLINLATDPDSDEPSENIIVKLTNEGFFEEVSFADSFGTEVEVLSNPLALEVFGDYTLVIFEVDDGNDYSEPNFQTKIYSSLQAGGIYLIHNESGKLYATKNVELTEETYTYTEDHSRSVRLMVTLNEPVYETQSVMQMDELNMPVVDEYGNPIYVDTQVQVFDGEGNPVIFTEGPILTETQEIPLMDHYKVQQVDDEGNLVFDEFGEPIYDYFDEPILDEFGNQIIQIQEVPLLDEFGEIQFQETFEVELFIQDIQEITVTEYSANVTDNPLTKVAQKFVDKIMAEYYNWNYYRVSSFMISQNGFAANDEYIFYTDLKPSENDSSVMETYVIRLSFDLETNDLLIEDYLPVTKAGWDNCEIILDPRNNNVVCDSWDRNIKIFSEELGIRVVADSENLQPVTFPNGELFFYDSTQTYIEELGYYTTVLYNINNDGTLEEHFIELGEKAQVCTGACNNYINFSFLDSEGSTYSNNHININLITGDNLISGADLNVIEVGEFDSTRPVCTDINGCWGSTLITIIDADGNFVTSFENYFTYYDDDIRPYEATYQIDETTVYDYQQQWSDLVLTCDNDLGCMNLVYLTDNSLNQTGLWMYGNTLVPIGDDLIYSITIPETNTGNYDYSKTVEGYTCDIEACDESVMVRIYDLADELISESSNYIHFEQGDVVPLHIDYHITDNTTITEKDTVCTTSTGCYEYYATTEGYYYYIDYAQGDTMYQTIEFDTTDKEVVTQETLTSEICTDIYGCYIDETEYFIVDDLGVTIYHFSQNTTADYGYRLPYTVTINVNDVNIQYKKENLAENAVCENTTCRQQVEFVFGLETWNYDTLGWGNMSFNLGDDIISRVRLISTEPVSTGNDMICQYDDGCTVYTEDFVIQDELGNVLDVATNEYYVVTVPVFFEKGEAMPSDNIVSATFEMTNIQYYKERIQVYDFIYNLSNVIILEDNLFLIERQSWSQGDDNFVLIYDEVSGRYSAKYTNISAVTEITRFDGGYVAIDDDGIAILSFVLNATTSTDDFYNYDIVNLTDGLFLNNVSDLIIDYDGSIYFIGVDSMVRDITGSISHDGVVTVDTELVEHEIIRLSPIN